MALNIKDAETERLLPKWRAGVRVEDGGDPPAPRAQAAASCWHEAVAAR
jgi:hypothetical protein